MSKAGLVQKMHFLKKFRMAAAELGFTNACIYVLNRCLSPLGGGMHLYRIVAQPVAAGSLLPNRRGQTITIRQVGPADSALKQMPLTQNVIRYRMEQNAICFGAFKSGEMIGCLWLCLGPYREDEVRCSFVPVPEGKASWDFDVYLRPEHRVGLCFARLWDEANRYLRSQGVAWSMSRISALNKRSLAAHARLGAQAIGTAFFFRIGSIQLTFASLSPRVHASFSRGCVPRFLLRAPDDRALPASTGARGDRMMVKSIGAGPID